MPQPTGRKRRFLGYGALNVALTNLVLQGLLVVMATGWATLLSQLLNAVSYTHLTLPTNREV